MEKQTVSSLIYGTLAQYKMLPQGMTVVVGFSGGADSTALLHWLFSHADALQIQVTAAHVNHGLRGAEAERDEQFVRDFCAQRAIPLQVLRADVRAEAEKQEKDSKNAAAVCGTHFFMRFANTIRMRALPPPTHFPTARKPCCLTLREAPAGRGFPVFHRCAGTLCGRFLG